MTFKENRNKEIIHKFEKLSNLCPMAREMESTPTIYIIKKGIGILQILDISRIYGLDLFGKVKYIITVRDKYDRRDELETDKNTLIQAMKTMQEIGEEYPEYGL